MTTVFVCSKNVKIFNFYSVNNDFSKSHIKQKLSQCLICFVTCQLFVIISEMY